MRITVLGLGGNSVFMSVDHFHNQGETLAANSLYYEPGGKGYNQAVAAARLGADVSFIGAFGSDSQADGCIDYLIKENIEALAVFKDVPSAYACIQTDRNGENRVTVYGGASALITAEDVNSFAEKIANSDMLILQNEVPKEANRAAFEIARRHGVTVMFNPAPAVGTDRELLMSADIITPNLHEAKMLFGENYREKIVTDAVGRAAVTLGADGADCYDGSWSTISAPKVRAVDTTGGGDCFNGALAVGICGGMNFMDACKFAVKAASVSVTRPHAVTSMPKIAEVLG